MIGFAFDQTQPSRTGVASEEQSSALTETDLLFLRQAMSRYCFGFLKKNGQKNDSTEQRCSFWLLLLDSMRISAYLRIYVHVYIYIYMNVYISYIDDIYIYIILMFKSLAYFCKVLCLSLSLFTINA